MSFLPAALLLSLDCTAQQATVTIDQDPKIPQLLALKNKMTKENKLSENYKIQLAYGSVKDANEVYNKYKNLLGQWEAAIEYERNYYKVWVGNYRNRLEADKALLAIKKEFPGAFVFKPSER